MKKWDITLTRSQHCAIRVEALSDEEARSLALKMGESETPDVQVVWTINEDDYYYVDDMIAICENCDKPLKKLFTEKHCCLAARKASEDAKRQRLLGDIERAKTSLVLFEQSLVEADKHE